MINDTEFILNRRDFPIPYESFDMSSDGAQPEWVRRAMCLPSGITPMTSDEMCDIMPTNGFLCAVQQYGSGYEIPTLIPTAKEWEMANMHISFDISTLSDAITNGIRNEVPSPPSTRFIQRAVFRGSATGTGVSADPANYNSYNVRLGLANISHSQEDAPFDFKLTSWNKRIKFQRDGSLRVIDSRSFPFTAGRHNFLSERDQRQYAVRVHADGHVGADRLALDLSSGCALVVVDENAQNPRSELFTHLVNGRDYVCVKKDLSDIRSVVEMLLRNNEICDRLGANSRQRFLEMCNRDSIMQRMAIGIRNSTRSVVFR